MDMSVGGNHFSKMPLALHLHIHKYTYILSKIVLGNNLQHLAPFPNPRARFNMFEVRSDFILFVLATTFWAQEQFFQIRASDLPWEMHRAKASP